MRMLTFITLSLASVLHPVLAQGDGKPPVSMEQQKSTDQSVAADNRVIDRDWKLKSGDDQQTVGTADRKSPDSANHYEQKIDRDWRAEPRTDDKDHQ